MHGESVLLHSLGCYRTNGCNFDSIQELMQLGLVLGSNHGQEIGHCRATGKGDNVDFPRQLIGGRCAALTGGDPEDLVEQPQVEARLRAVMGTVYRELGRFDEAARGFAAILADRPADGPARVLLARCRAYAETYSWRACAEEFVKNLTPQPKPERKRFWRRIRRLGRP